MLRTADKNIIATIPSITLLNQKDKKRAHTKKKRGNQSNSSKYTNSIYRIQLQKSFGPPRNPHYHSIECKNIFAKRRMNDRGGKNK